MYNRIVVGSILVSDTDKDYSAFVVLRRLDTIVALCKLDTTRVFWRDVSYVEGRGEVVKLNEGVFAPMV